MPGATHRPRPVICDGLISGPAEPVRSLSYDLRRGSLAGKGPRRPGQRTHQQIECDDVRDNQYGHVDDWDRVGGAQFPRQWSKADLNAVIVVDNDVDGAHDIESDDKQPKKRTYSYGQKRQHGQHSGREVTVSSEDGEVGRQIGADDTWKDEDEPEEAEAVQSGDEALCFDLVHRLEPGQHIHTDEKQPRDV